LESSRNIGAISLVTIAIVAFIEGDLVSTEHDFDEALYKNEFSRFSKVYFKYSWRKYNFMNFRVMTEEYSNM